MGRARAYSCECCSLALNYLAGLDASATAYSMIADATPGTDVAAGFEVGGTSDDLRPRWKPEVTGDNPATFSVPGEAIAVGTSKAFVSNSPGGVQGVVAVAEPSALVAGTATRGYDLGGGYELTTRTFAPTRPSWSVYPVGGVLEASQVAAYDGQCVATSGSASIQQAAAITAAGDAMVKLFPALDLDGGDPAKLVAAKHTGSAIAIVQESTNAQKLGLNWQFVGGENGETISGRGRIHVMAPQDYTSCLGVATEIGAIITETLDPPAGGADRRATATVSMKVYEGAFVENGEFAEMTKGTLLFTADRTAQHDYDSASAPSDNSLKASLLVDDPAMSYPGSPYVRCVTHETNRHGDTLSLVEVLGPNTSGGLGGGGIGGDDGLEERRLYLNGTLFYTEYPKQTSTGLTIVDAACVDPDGSITGGARWAVSVRDKAAGKRVQCLLDSSKSVIWSQEQDDPEGSATLSLLTIFGSTDRHVCFGGYDISGFTIGDWAQIDGARQFPIGTSLDERPYRLSGIKNSASLSWSVPLGIGDGPGTPDTGLFS